MSLIEDIFTQKGTRLYWRRIDDDRVDPAPDGVPFLSEEGYFVVRLTAMYLARTRVAWRKYYPMLHGFTSSGNEQEHAVVDPSRLREFGDGNLDRIVIMNERLCGPIPFRGQDVSITVGLYAVPGQDAAKALLNTIGSVAALGGLALGTAAQVAEVVKQGVESVLNLGETRLQLGIRDTFYANNPLTPGYHVGIAAEQKDLDVGRLWLSKGTLLVGDDPVAAQPFKAYDYMVIEIQRSSRRDDWPGIPGLQQFDKQFGDILRDAGTTIDEKRKRINQVWPGFRQALVDAQQLVTSDRERIALSVAENLRQRMEGLSSGVFELKGWKQDGAASTAPDDFDLIDVDDALDVSSPQGRAAARDALSAVPF